MKYISYLLAFNLVFSSMTASFYADSLDFIITEKIQVLKKSSYEVKNIEKIERKLEKNIKKQPYAQDVNYFLDRENSVAFFFNDQVALQLNGDLSDEAIVALEDFKDLKFAIGAKLYLYYLTCCKEKILYKATKNYDALQYWKNEQFSESLAFYKKNVLRWISRSSYQEKIERNIAALEKLSYTTNYFLGLICNNQDLLLQSKTEQEFKNNVMQAVQLQNQFLHIEDDLCCDDMGLVIKTSLDQIYNFNLHLSQLYAQCQLPSHAVRNWKAYTISAATMCACAYVYLTYGDVIMQSSQHFYQDHVEGPLKRNIEYFSGVAKPAQFDVEATKKSLKVSEEAATTRPFPKGKKDSLDESLALVASELTGGESTKLYKNLVEKSQLTDEILKTLVPMINKIGPAVDDSMPITKDVVGIWNDVVRPSVAKHKNATILNPFADATLIEGLTKSFNFHYSLWLKQNLKPIDDIINSPTRVVKTDFNPLVLPPSLQSSVNNAIPSEYGQSIILQTQCPDNISQKDKDDIILANTLKNPIDAVDAGRREILRIRIEGENHLNKTLKDVHMLFGLTALIPIVTVVGGSLFASKNIYNSVAYQPIRKFVRQLEVLLNEVLHQQPTCDRQGHLCFLVEQLSLNIEVLTLGEQKMIQEDIAALKNNRLDYVQKYNVIQRMYKTYPCLLPGSIGLFPGAV